MSIPLAIFLGLIQGLAEFLPISSSGHLILVQHIFEMPQDMMFFNIMLHIATLIAVCFVFRKRTFKLVRHPFHPDNRRLNFCLILATAITVGFVLLFNDFLESTFTARVLPITFLITAIVLVWASFVKPGKNQLTYTTAAALGLAQGLAIIPGLSRSGLTLSTALTSGIQRDHAAEFAFLMSIPIIIAALVWELVRNPISTTINWLPLSIAFIVALLSGVFAIKFMLDIIRRVKLYWLSLYLIVIALVALFMI